MKSIHLRTTSDNFIYEDISHSQLGAKPTSIVRDIAYNYHCS